MIVTTNKIFDFRHYLSEQFQFNGIYTGKSL